MPDLQPQTLLFRQIHPTQIKETTVSTQAFEIQSSAFVPKENDKGLLSVYNGERFTAEAAHVHYTGLGRSSAGVLAVTVNECGEENLPSKEDNNPFEGHAHIDFNGLIGKGAIKKAASNLRDKAVARGWLFSKPG